MPIRVPWEAAHSWSMTRIYGSFDAPLPRCLSPISPLGYGILSVLPQEGKFSTYRAHITNGKETFCWIDPPSVRAATTRDPDSSWLSCGRRGDNIFALTGCPPTKTFCTCISFSIVVTSLTQWWLLPFLIAGFKAFLDNENWVISVFGGNPTRVGMHGQLCTSSYRLGSVSRLLHLLSTASVASWCLQQLKRRTKTKLRLSRA